jgi:hypothetical protein
MTMVLNVIVVVEWVLGIPDIDLVCDVCFEMLEGWDTKEGEDFRLVYSGLLYSMPFASDVSNTC